MLNPWFVTGLIEGEGSFTYSRSDRNITLYFALRLAAIDRPLVEHVREFFEFAGVIYDTPPVPPRGPGTGYTKASSYYRVSRLDEIPIIVRHFDAYPLVGSRVLSYAIWREMAELKRYRKGPIKALNSLAEHLSLINPRKSPWSPGKS